MSLSGNQDQLHVRYPMGPKIRSWLEISDLDYKGDSNSNPTPAELDAFQTKLMLHMEDVEIKNGDQLADLLE